MTLLLNKISASPAFICCFLLYFQSVSALGNLQRSQATVVHLENEEFVLECSITGTQDELKNIEITWEGPSPEYLGQVVAITGSGVNSTYTVKAVREPSKLTSKLTFRKPPEFSYSHNRLSYHCKAPGAGQHSFPYRVVRAKAVPKIQPFEVKPQKPGDSITLNCTVLYDNDNSAATFKLMLNWTKEGEVLYSKTFDYKRGKQTETIKHTIVIGSYKDGGKYACEWVLKEGSATATKSSTYILEILPKNQGPAEKEIKKTAGDDVELKCDVVGYPIVYEWKIDKKPIVSDSRITVNNDVLEIDDIDYEDRKQYTCIGKVDNTTAQQIIILRVKDALAPLWPFIGILIEAVVVAAIIILTERFSCKRQNQSDKDGGEAKTETTEAMPSTSQA